MTMKDSEVTTRLSDERLAELIRGLPAAVYECLHDRDWTMEYLSETIEEVTGHGAADFLGNQVRSYASVIHPEDQEWVWASIQQAVGEQRFFDVEYRIRHRDGQIRWVWERGQAVMREGESIRLQGFIADITERRRAELEMRQIAGQLREQQKLDFIGVFAAGVAHEINNPINGVMNYAEIIQDLLPPDSPLREYTAEILHETRRVAGIVRDLLTFSRRDMQSHSATTLRSIVDSTLSLIRTIVRRDHIDLRVGVLDGLPLVRCNEQQIRQVLMNLLTNARDALNLRYPENHPDKVLRIEADCFEEGERPWVRLTVEDHGVGIPPELIGRIFEPFFTTKSRSHGTGLGLAISYSIVQEHQGRLLVESEPGRTRFYLELPAEKA